MIVVSDTSVLSNLLQIEKEYLLTRLFQSVFISPSVNLEMKASPAFPRFEEMLKSGMISIKEISDFSLYQRLNEIIDEGEAEAIVLAKELNADFLLIDERLGNTIAKQYGLKTTGLLGILIDAKKAGYIPEVKRLVIELRSKTRFRITEEVFQTVLTLAGEL